MQFLAARSLWTNLLAFRYAMPSAISPAIWIIFLSGGRTWLVAFCGRARGDEVRAGKHTVVSRFSVFLSSALQSKGVDVVCGKVHMGVEERLNKEEQGVCMCWLIGMFVSDNSHHHMCIKRLHRISVFLCVGKGWLLLCAGSVGSSWDRHGSSAP